MKCIDFEIFLCKKDKNQNILCNSQPQDLYTLVDCKLDSQESNFLARYRLHRQDYTRHIMLDRKCN